MNSNLPAVVVGFRLHDADPTQVPSMTSAALVRDIKQSGRTTANTENLSRLLPVQNAISAGRPLMSGTAATKGEASLEIALFNSRAEFKIATATVAMHIDRLVRDQIFEQIDELYDADEWDEDDAPGNAPSFKTFLRMFLFVKPAKRPALGTTHQGNLVAAWFKGGDRLAIECHADDNLHFVLTAVTDEKQESVSGKTSVSRIVDALQPYSPARWFEK